MARVNMDRFKAASEKLKKNLKKQIEIEEVKETTVESPIITKTEESRNLWVL